MAQQTMPRYQTLEAWRGIAILWITVFHFTFPVNTLPWHPFFEWFRPIAAHGYLGVNLFFVISGYGVAASITRLSGAPQAAWTFLKRRVRRLFPVYWASCLFTILLTLLMWEFHRHGGSPAPLGERLPIGVRGWIGNIFLIQPYLHVPYLNVVYWFLVVEVGFYLLVALFMPLNARVACGMAGILALVGCLMPGKPLFYEPMVFTILRSWPEFLCGMLVYQIHRRWIEKGVWDWLLIGAMAAMGILSALSPFSRLDGHVGLVWFSAPFSLCLVALIRWDSWLKERPWVVPFTALGAFSYSLYLIQLPLTRWMVPVQQHGAQSLVYFGWLALGITGTILVGWIFFQLVEKPLQRL